MYLIKSFRAARWIRTINLVLQSILFLTLFGGLNYLAVYYPWRFDLTHLRSHSLSGETLSYLKQLTQPIKVYVTIRKTKEDDDSIEAQAYRDVTELLREYVYATESNPEAHITFEYVDVYQRGREATELGLSVPNITLIKCGDKQHLVDLKDFYRFEGKEKKEFLGEQVITAAILDVSSPEKKKIYFLTGHGEMDIGNTSEERGLSTLASQLRLRNFEIDRLDLTIRGSIPKDATLIISAGQMTRYSATEEEQLRKYLSNSTSDRPGRLLLCIPPGLPANAQLETSGLENLLYEWGILADDVVIHNINPASINDTEDLVLSAFAPNHEITQQFISNQIRARFGVSRSVRVNPSRAADESLTVTRLIGVNTENDPNSAMAWGERNYRRAPFIYNPPFDLPGNLIGFAVASERVKAKDKDLPYSVQAGRVVVFGCSDFISNNRLEIEGNLTLILSSINWLVGRGPQLNVLARPIPKFQLTLNQQELSRLRNSLLYILPSAAGLLGLVVYWTRRR